MVTFQHKKCAVTAAAVLVLGGISLSSHAQQESADHSATNMTVIVKEYESSAPISQAHITLQFDEPHGPTIPRKPKKIVYNAKTDLQGRYKFTGINKGPIVLMITASGRQSYGKELQLDKNNQVFEIRLKKPQPLL